jgi:mRNA interferase YafQ
VRTISIHTTFKKEFNKFKKNLSFEELDIFYSEIISNLKNDIPLAEKYRDHQLTGNYKNFRECHVKPDLLLVYTKIDNKLILARFNSHSEIFK